MLEVFQLHALVTSSIFMLRFAIFPSDTYRRGVFLSILFIFFQACFPSTRANPGFYELKNFIFTRPP